MAAEPSDPGGERQPGPPARRFRLPRVVYWLAGAAIAASGAAIARQAAEAFPRYQIVLWGIGAAVIFVGLAVLSLGTRSRLEGDEEGSGTP